MTTLNKKFDALLLHSYWYDLKNPGKLDICNEVQILAVRELLKKNDIKNIIIAGGKLYFKSPPIGTKIKSQLLKLLPKKYHDSILVIPNKKTTLGEIVEFENISRKNGWNKLASLGLKIHLPRIKKSFKHAFGGKENITFFSAEELIRKKSILKKFKSSDELKILSANEKIVTNIQKMPFGEMILELFAMIFTHKGYLQPKLVSFFTRKSKKSNL